MSFKDFIQNENVSKDTKLEDKIKKIVSDEIDYKNIKFDYSDNEMKVYITPEDEDENCLILGKKLEKLFKNKIPGFMVYNDTKNKGSFTIDLSVEHINENAINDVPAPFQGILKRFDGYLKFQFGKIEFVNCQVEKSNIFIKYKSTKSNKGHKLTFKVTDSLDRMFGYMFVIRPVSGKLDSEDIIISVAPKKLFLDKFDGKFEKTMAYCSAELSKNLKESTLSEEVKMLMSERPSLIVKAGRLKKLRKFHKTSQFKNVIHKKNLRALKTAAGIKKKRAKKRYMKKYTRKYGKIMALRAKKYQNIVKESFLNEKLKFIQDPKKYGVNNLVCDRPLTKYMLDFLLEKGEINRHGIDPRDKPYIIYKDAIPEYGIAYLDGRHYPSLIIRALRKDGSFNTVFSSSDYYFQDFSRNMSMFEDLKELFADELKIKVGSNFGKILQSLKTMNDTDVFNFITKNAKDFKDVEINDPKNGSFKIKTKNFGNFRLNTKEKEISFLGRRKFYEIIYSDKVLYDNYEETEKVKKLFGVDCFSEKNLQPTSIRKEFEEFAKDVAKEYSSYTKEDINPFIEKLNASLLDIAKKSKLDLIFSDLTCDYDSSDKKYLNVSFKITRNIKE